jgi:hypothetical protein
MVLLEVGDNLMIRQKQAKLETGEVRANSQVYKEWSAQVNPSKRDGRDLLNRTKGKGKDRNRGKAKADSMHAVQCSKLDRKLGRADRRKAAIAAKRTKKSELIRIEN